MKANPGIPSMTEAESLVRHLTTKMGEDDIEAVVNCLSDALNLAKAKMYDAGRTCTRFDESCASDYWLG